MITELSGTTNETFFTYCDKCLIPALQAAPGHSWVCLMDNLRSHHFAPTKQLFDWAGYDLIFRPKYSPDLAYIEMVIHLVKSYLRRHHAHITTKNLPFWVEQALLAVTGFRGLMQHCGY